MANKKRYFVRLSGSRTPVLGSLIVRSKKPNEGIWEEVFFNKECCRCKVGAVDLPVGYASADDLTIELTVTATTGASYTVTLGADAEDVEEAGYTMARVDKYLSDSYGSIGNFYIKDGKLVAEVCDEFAASVSVAFAD